MKKDYITFYAEHDYKSQAELEEKIRKYLFEDSNTPLPPKLHQVGIRLEKELITVSRRDWNDLIFKKKKAIKAIVDEPMEPTAVKEPPYNPFRETLQCSKCKKKLKSRSGLALHKKRCKK